MLTLEQRHLNFVGPIYFGTFFKKQHKESILLINKNSKKMGHFRSANILAYLL